MMASVCAGLTTCASAINRNRRPMGVAVPANRLGSTSAAFSATHAARASLEQQPPLHSPPIALWTAVAAAIVDSTGLVAARFLARLAQRDYLCGCGS
eukprot:CAMPEP_0169086456 /NCGR_PEP_ID=MMETSP1015-20121227/13708_1 /TAXON_ID=342587 /ORGANISM="Karlodinium micrum, Strain CCMP2283" /LENGTH=96 /DNA_ID=CAMNT_0009146621 /DNA_START=585 /DNA_END=876 /DNA_ORIENTATION=-